MDVLEAIRTRRSIRRYTDEPVSREQIEEVIQAGRFAPSAENRQPWRFIVVTDREVIAWLSGKIREAIRRLLRYRGIARLWMKELRDTRVLKLLYGVAYAEQDLIFFDAPVVVFIVTRDVRFNDESCACCAQNMMLAAHAMGLGSCWIGFASALGLKKAVLRDIGMPDGHHIAATLTIGHPRGSPQPQMRKPMADVINWIE
ncbi:MAG: nitroreductase [Thermoplasmatota archaeon]